MTPRDLEALARLVAPLVLKHLAAGLQGAERPYSTRKGHGPVGVAEERWKAIAPSLPGAYRVGRWWTVPRSSVDTWLASHAATSAAPKTSNDSKPWTAKAALSAAGLRATR